MIQPGFLPCKGRVFQWIRVLPGDLLKRESIEAVVVMVGFGLTHASCSAT